MRATLVIPNSLRLYFKIQAYAYYKRSTKNVSVNEQTYPKSPVFKEHIVDNTTLNCTSDNQRISKQKLHRQINVSSLMLKLKIFSDASNEK